MTLIPSVQIRKLTWRLDDFPGPQNNQVKEFRLHCKKSDSTARFGALVLQQRIERDTDELKKNVRGGRKKTEEWFLRGVGVPTSLCLLGAPLSVYTLLSKRKCQLSYLSPPDWYSDSGSHLGPKSVTVPGVRRVSPRLLEECMYVKGMTAGRGKKVQARLFKTSLLLLFLQHSISELFPSQAAW